MWARLIACISLFIIAGCQAPRGENHIQSIGSGEFVFSESPTAPTSGWSKTEFPMHDFMQAPTGPHSARTTLWMRMEFNGRNAEALVADYTSERVTVFLNGRQIFKNYSDPSTRTFASFAPTEFELPKSIIKPGANSVTFKMESDTAWCLGIGNVLVGPAVVLRAKYESAYFWQFLGSQIVNGIVAALTLCIFLFWLRRRQEKAFFWLALVGIFWFIRNLHYSAVDPTFGPTLLWELAMAALFGLVPVFCGFVVTFFNLANRRTWILVASLAGVGMIALRLILITNEMSDLPAFLLLLPSVSMFVVIAARVAASQWTRENILMLFAMLVAVGFSAHDFGFLAKAWRGMGFQIQPYGSLIVYLAFLFALGRRILNAFGTVENMAAELEQRVVVAKRQLATSEEARHQLEINSALERERERIMREMHDRIGSSLVAAMAAAKGRGVPAEALSTLKNALLELRITVDSLEPLDGDLSLLLASFRHRVERDLNAAGLVFDWRVEATPAIDWLDAPNALHIMRTMQEAIANILAHAGATIVTVVCREHAKADRLGVRVQLTDNGNGSVSALHTPGKGISNMRARIEGLHGSFDISSKVGIGTSITIWIPVSRIISVAPQG